MVRERRRHPLQARQERQRLRPDEHGPRRRYRRDLRRVRRPVADAADGASSSTRTAPARTRAGRPSSWRRRPGWSTRCREAGLRPVRAGGLPDPPTPRPLALDETRLAEVDEAWVPVVTPDGPGVLVRENSD
ncbi:DUF6210 family protein [Streptomyces sp. NPDC001450]